MINGILNIHKEAGYTSHDVVAKVRGIVHQKKVGHTGTLDPAATGVLPVCLGKATKVCNLIGSWDKTYRAVLLLGRETDTEDITGQILRESPVEISPERVAEIMRSFQGTYLQIPPMYSAKKVSGKKLYEIAREGKTIDRKPCQVEIRDLKILCMDLPEVEFEVTCSKGTYIRSLCRDIGTRAGCGGCMASLVRTRVSEYSLEDALFLSQIETLQNEGKLTERIHSIDSVFSGYPSLTVGEEGNALLMNGNTVPAGYIDKQDHISGDRPENPEGNVRFYRVYDFRNHFIGLYEYTEQQGVIRPRKLFFDL